MQLDAPAAAPVPEVEHPLVPAPTQAGQAALGRKAAAPAALRAYKADWTHYAAWCAAHGFVPVPAAPATVGAYLASLKDSHAPTTVRRRLSAAGFRPSARCTGSMTCPGTLGTATSRSRCKACCASAAGPCARPPP